jgi:hypothetical protein
MPLQLLQRSLHAREPLLERFRSELAGQLPKLGLVQYQLADGVHEPIERFGLHADRAQPAGPRRFALGPGPGVGLPTIPMGRGLNADLDDLGNGPQGARDLLRDVFGFEIRVDDPAVPARLDGGDRRAEILDAAEGLQAPDSEKATSAGGDGVGSDPETDAHADARPGPLGGRLLHLKLRRNGCFAHRGCFIGGLSRGHGGTDLRAER